MDKIRKLELLNRELQIENNIIKKTYKQKIEEYEKLNKRMESERNELQEKLDSIIYSRSYKILQIIKKIGKRG